MRGRENVEEDELLRGHKNVEEEGEDRKTISRDGNREKQGVVYESQNVKELIKKFDKIY